MCTFNANEQLQSTLWHISVPCKPPVLNRAEIPLSPSNNVSIPSIYVEISKVSKDRHRIIRAVCLLSTVRTSMPCVLLHLFDDIAHVAQSDRSLTLSPRLFHCSLLARQSRGRDVECLAADKFDVR
nr:hypothetical protein CFP56_55965 [Quercus suber]